MPPKRQPPDQNQKTLEEGIEEIEREREEREKGAAREQTERLINELQEDRKERDSTYRPWTVKR